MSNAKTNKLTEEDKKRLLISWLEDALEKIDDVTSTNTTEEYKEREIALEEIRNCIDILKGEDINLTPFELLQRPTFQKLIS